MNLNTLKDEIFVLYAVKENERYNHFYKNFHNSICTLIGKKDTDFSKVSIVIDEEIDFKKDSHFYDGKLCGFYDFDKKELNESYIYNSLLQTIVCFPYSPENYHRKKGLFVTLKILNNSI